MVFTSIMTPSAFVTTIFSKSRMPSLKSSIFFISSAQAIKDASLNNITGPGPLKSKTGPVVSSTVTVLEAVARLPAASDIS